VDVGVGQFVLEKLSRIILTGGANLKKQTCFSLTLTTLCIKFLENLNY
jgi:hypothetical protein